MKLRARWSFAPALLVLLIWNGSSALAGTAATTEAPPQPLIVCDGGHATLARGPEEGAICLCYSAKRSAGAGCSKSGSSQTTRDESQRLVTGLETVGIRVVGKDVTATDLARQLQAQLGWEVVVEDAVKGFALKEIYWRGKWQDLPTVVWQDQRIDMVIDEKANTITLK